MDALEATLASLSFLEHLRPDEIARVARHFTTRSLSAGERAHDAAQHLVVVVRGRLELVVSAPGRELSATLVAGDRHGEVALFTGTARETTLVARRAAVVALVDRAGLDAIIAEFPSVAQPLAIELSRELRASNDVARQLLEIWAEDLSPAQRMSAIAGRRLAMQRRGARVTRLSVRSLFRRTIVDRGGEPPFWAMVGFLLSLLGARLVVALILKYGLEKRLFALVPGTDPNPMHVHHFNYGLLLIATAGLAALFPFGRRALRVLGLVLGLGAGLVFDEFALFWNLNPEYAQALSLYSAAIALVVLVNLTYFRLFWRAVVRRAWLIGRSA